MGAGRAAGLDFTAIDPRHTSVRVSSVLCPTAESEAKTSVNGETWDGLCTPSTLLILLGGRGEPRQVLQEQVGCIRCKFSCLTTEA